MSKIVFKGQTTDGTTYLIRYPKRTDLLELLRYINELSKEKTFISFQGEEITLEEERKFLNDSIKLINNKKGILFLAESEGKIIGVSDVRMRQRISSHIGVFGISIAKDFRSRGIGTKLMKSAIDESVKNLAGLKIIELDCFANNPIAPDLYRSCGFKEYGRLPKGLKHKGEFVDDILMYYEVKP